MKKQITTLLALVAVSLSVFAKPVARDARTHVALDGYDPVAFHTVGQARKGNPAVTLERDGTIYYFQDEDSRKVFESDPERYLPAYGGYCAYGASVGSLFPVDISTWEIRDGRLILQYNQEIKALFGQDFEANLKKADEYWDSLN